MHEEWRSKVAELNLRKRYQDSAEILREKMKLGDLSAHAMLARIGSVVGLTQNEVNELISYVEANLKPDDIDAHLELHAAYDQRLGEIPYEQKARRSLDHLKVAAELGAGSIYSLAVARIYRVGTLNVSPDLIEAKQWYKRAIEQGSVEAMHEIQGLHRQMRAR